MNKLTATEREFTDQLIGKRGLLPILGWAFTHSRPARTARTFINKKGEEQALWVTAIQGMPGFPDILAAKEFGTVGAQIAKTNKEGRLIFAELKVGNSKPTLEQVMWLNLLTACGQEVYLWMPSDLEEIQIILTMGHAPTRLERLELKSAWVSLRIELKIEAVEQR